MTKTFFRATQFGDLDGDGLIDALELRPDKKDNEGLRQISFAGPLLLHRGLRQGGSTNLFHSPVPFIGQVGCHNPAAARPDIPTDCGQNVACDNCTSDNAMTSVLISDDGVNRYSTPVLRRRFASPMTGTRTARASSLARIALADVDGNGVVDAFFRDTVQAHQLEFQFGDGTRAWTGANIPNGDWNNAIDISDGPIVGEMPGRNYYRASLLSGGGFREDFSVGMPVPQPKPHDATEAHDYLEYYHVSDAFSLVDLTGDGRPDLLRRDRHVLYAQVNLGNGEWGDPISFDLSATSLPGVTAEAGDYPATSIADVDGDGTLEVIALTSGRVLRVAGLAWSESAIPIPSLAEDPIYFKDVHGDIIPAVGATTAEASHFVDLDRDGDADFLGLQKAPAASPGTAAAQPRLVVSMNLGRRYQLKSLTQGPYSSSVTIEWKDYQPSECVHPLSCAKERHSVATHLVAINETGTVDAAFTYGEPRTNLQGLGWLGFGQRQVAIPARGVTIVETFDNGTPVARTGTPSGSYWYPGARRPRKVVTTKDSRGQSTSQSGQVIRTTETFGYEDSYPQQALRLTSYLNRYTMTEEVGTVVSGQGSSQASGFIATRSSKTTTTRTNGTVTLQRVDSWEGAATALGEPPSGVETKWTEQTTLLYADNTPAWLIGLPQRTTVTSHWPGSPSQTRTVAFDYEPGKPIVHEVTVEPDNNTAQGPNASGFQRKTRFIRNQTYGVLDRIEDEAWTQAFDQSAPVLQQRQTVFSAYDPEHVFPRTVRNPEQHTTDFYFLPSTGALVARSTSIGTGGMGDKTVEWQQDLDTAGRPVKQQATGLPDVTIAYYSDHWEVTSAPYGTQRTFVDAFLRPTEVQTPGWNGMTVKQTYSYDRGMLQSVSYPHKARPEFITYSYDALGRPTTETNTGTGRQRTWAYSPSAPFSWKTVETAIGGAKKETYTDSVGSQRRLRELLSSSTAGGEVWSQQDFTYDAFGLLRTITDSAQPSLSTIFAYDNLGRPRSVSDPDSGTKSMLYNGFGELTRVETPLDTIEYKRDKLSRILKRQTTPAGGGAVLATYDWDTSNYGLGQLASSTSEDGIVQEFGYDELGRPNVESWTIDGTKYSASMAYDENSRLNTLTYPRLGSSTATKLKYFYGSDGRVSRVEDDGSGRIFWGVLDRSATGQVLLSQSGAAAGVINSNFRSEYVYDTGNRLSHLKVTDLQGTPLLALKYDYDHNGVAARHDRSDPANLITENYGYDLAGRLTDWNIRQGSGGSTCNVKTHHRFTYSTTGNLERDDILDGAGNILSTPALATYGPSSNPSAIQTLQENTLLTSFTTNAVGNQTVATVAGNADRVLTYRADGQLATATNPLGAWKMEYDADGDRVQVRKLNTSGQPIPGAQIIELGRLAVRHSDGHLSFNVIVEGEVVAVVSKRNNGVYWTSDVRYVHSDALGSPSVIVSEAYGVLDRPHYSPFGDRRQPLNLNQRSSDRHPERIGFAASVPDDDLQMAKMGVRSYDAHTARFLTPDPLYFTGQGLNPYSYVRNSPMNFVDPSGMQPACVSQTSTGGTGSVCGESGGSTAGVPWTSSVPHSSLSSPTSGEYVFMSVVNSSQQALDDTTRYEPQQVTAGQPRYPYFQPNYSFDVSIQNVSWKTLLDLRNGHPYYRLEFVRQFEAVNGPMDPALRHLVLGDAPKQLELFGRLEAAGAMLDVVTLSGGLEARGVWARPLTPLLAPLETGGASVAARGALGVGDDFVRYSPLRKLRSGDLRHTS